MDILVRKPWSQIPLVDSELHEVADLQRAAGETPNALPLLTLKMEQQDGQGCAVCRGAQPKQSSH